jgi:hypothetical protein
VRKIFSLFLIFCVLAIADQPTPVRSDSGGPYKVYIPRVESHQMASPLPDPFLQWAYGGCYSSWCETGWYSSPAAIDTNGDNQYDQVIASAYSLFALDGKTGSLVWRVGSTSNRTWPGIVVADIDQDNQQEIVIAQSGGYVSAYRLDGSLKWQKQPAGNSGELRGLLSADLDGNGSPLEIVVTRAYGSAKNTWVLDSSGNTRANWPQLPLDNNNSNGYGWGVYNANAAAADINRDGRLELVVPSDVHYINAYEPDGSPILAKQTLYPGKYWGQVGVWESLVPEQRGWGACDGKRVESYRANFADGPAVLADVNGDGLREVVAVGNMYDCFAGYPPSRYMALFIFNPDRSRFNKDGFDWSTIPINTGAPLSEDYNVIESVEPNPVVADLDGDGKQEILYSSYDGRVHAFWLDKTEHGSWPYSVYKSSENVYRFASEPVVADLNNDGKADVIFTSWTQKGSNQNGKLHILNSEGQMLSEINLPNPRSSTVSWNGGLAAPTLADIDGDSNLEVIINTANSGVVVYDLPHTSHARILWGTGRGNFNRTGGK